MKASTFYLAFSIAQLATCAPTPGDLIQRMDGIPDRRGHGTAEPPRVWSPYHSENDAPTPDGHDSPSVPPRPIDAQLPPRLSKHQRPGARLPRPGTVELIRQRYAVVDESEVLELLGIDTGASQTGLPRYQDERSREHNNMLIVFLAATFIVAVVVTETCISRR